MTTWLWEIPSIELCIMLHEAGLIGKPARPEPTPQPMVVEVIRRDGRLFCGACGKTQIYRGNKRCRPCYVKYVAWKEHLRYQVRATQTHACADCQEQIPVQAKRCHPCAHRYRTQYKRDYYRAYHARGVLDNGSPDLPNELAS
ncbi:MAG: hypothetical protein KGL39_31180 [Patescibacteria group bacterium]|nr:hypothetical protein [Patescibacteria group bacterium]